MDSETEQKASTVEPCVALIQKVFAWDQKQRKQPLVVYFKLHFKFTCVDKGISIQNVEMKDTTSGLCSKLYALP